MLSPIVGVLMAEFVADGKASTLDITLYRLERFAEGRELRNGYQDAGVIENFEVQRGSRPQFKSSPRNQT